MTSSQHVTLQHHLYAFAQLQEADIHLADGCWQSRTIARHDLFNFQHAICRHVGFVVNGIFRVYYTDPKTGQEHNLYFVAENRFLTSLKSVLTQTSCPYLIEALEDSELLVIQYDQLQDLYSRSHGWERFGRFLAEEYFMLNQSRAESLLTQTAEERYIDLLEHHPNLTNRVSLGHISSYLGIKGPSLSRIRAHVAHR